MGIQFGEKLLKTIVDITCDICRDSCKDNLDNFECALLESRWGYSSLKDGEQHSCYMCEKCYDKIKNYIELMGGKVRIKN